MAITTQQVYLANDVENDFAPVGHVVPLVPANIGTVAAGRDKEIEFSVAATDRNANKVTAFDALILTTLVAAIDAWIVAIAGTPEGLNIDISNTVQYNARVTKILGGAGPTNHILLSSATDVFRITVSFQYASS